MNDVLIGGLITATAMVTVALITGFWAWKNKRTPEPTPIEKLWARLDTLETKSTDQQSKIDSQGTEIRSLKGEVRTLKDQVVAYRGGFLAHVSWAARVKEQWTGSIPIVTFTAAEEAAIARGLEMSELEALGDEEQPEQ